MFVHRKRKVSRGSWSSVGKTRGTAGHTCHYCCSQSGAESFSQGCNWTLWCNNSSKITTRRRRLDCRLVMLPNNFPRHPLLRVPTFVFVVEKEWLCNRCHRMTFLRSCILLLRATLWQPSAALIHRVAEETRVLKSLKSCRSCWKNSMCSIFYPGAVLASLFVCI